MASALFASSGLVAGAAPTVEPGLWEVMTKVDLPKLPFGLSIPRGLPLPQSGSRRFCVAQSDRDSPQSLVKAQTGCDLAGWQAAEGGRIDWRASCEGQIPTTSAGTMTLGDGSLQGTGTVTARIEGFSLHIHVDYTGRRLGDCL